MDWFLYDRDLRHERIKSVTMQNYERTLDQQFETVKLFLYYRKMSGRK